ncbi:MAG: BMC domain-containing protein [Vibrio sp.]|uniref:BMC domain-containing protein n=1 Tax=Vibrio sp. TaxID=678 RepID=UPI003A898CB7
MNAIGMIETKGLLAAIEAADVMLKAADVSLLDKSNATGGLITMTVTGEVSAVTAAIEAATLAVHRLNESLLVSKHVIARPSTSLDKIISVMPSSTIVPASTSEQEHSHKEDSKKEPNVETKGEAVDFPDQDSAEVTEQTSVNINNETEAAPVKASINQQNEVGYTLTQLQKMNLVSLRKIVKNLSGLDAVNIDKATKKELINILRENQNNKGNR